MKEFREVSLNIELENGSYVIVPSTQTAGQVGAFFLNIYYQCAKGEIEITKVGSNQKPEPIQEEEEASLHYDNELKAVLRIK